MSNASGHNQVSSRTKPSSLVSFTELYLTYIQAVQDNGKPHGKNITEVSSFDNATNASENEVGSKNDPSRAAINRMQETDVPSSGVPGDRKNTIDDQNKFSATGGDTSA